MAQLSYASFDGDPDPDYAVSTTGVVNRSFQGTGSLGDAAVITHASLATATFFVRGSHTDRVPVDVVGLLGTNLIRGDQIGWTGKAGGVTIFSRPLTAIADDWPLGKPRHVLEAIPRSDGVPVWMDALEIYVRFQGTRFFGRAWCGPSLRFAPTIDLGYSWNDTGARVDRTITGQASFAEMPIRRATSATCQNMTQADVFDGADFLPFGETIAVLTAWRRAFEDGYLRRGSRMLFLPVEVGAYQSRLAEYCRLSADVGFRHTQGPKLSLALSVEED